MQVASAIKKVQAMKWSLIAARVCLGGLGSGRWSRRGRLRLGQAQLLHVGLEEDLDAPVLLSPVGRGVAGDRIELAQSRGRELRSRDALGDHELGDGDGPRR